MSHDPVGVLPVKGKEAVVQSFAPLEKRFEPANVSSDGKQVAVFFEYGDSGKAYQFMTLNRDAQIETIRCFHSGDPKSATYKRTQAGMLKLLAAMNTDNSTTTFDAFLASEIKVEDPVGSGQMERHAFADILMDTARAYTSTFRNIVISADGVSVGLFWELSGPNGTSGLIHEHQWQ